MRIMHILEISHAFRRLLIDGFLRLQAELRVPISIHPHSSNFLLSVPHIFGFSRVHLLGRA